MVFRYESDQSGMAIGNFNLPYGISCQAQFQFPDSKCTEVMQMIQLEKAFRDNTVSARFQGMNFSGIWSLTYMQSLSKNI